MSAIEEAERLLDRVRQAITDAGLSAKAEATMDPAQIPGILASKVALCLSPESLTWPTWAIEDIEWAIDVISGPPGKALKAWRCMQPVLDALHAGGIGDSAKPSTYTLRGGSEYPAFTITTRS